MGPSGSGKSALAARLIQQWLDRGRHARWVGDDRIRIRQVGHRLVACSPEPLQGFAERRFAGIRQVTYMKSAVIDLAVRLTEKNDLERLPELLWYDPLSGSARIPLIRVPTDDPVLAQDLIAAKLCEN